MEKAELVSKKDAMSFLMLINSIKSSEEFKELKLPEGYLDELLRDSPDSVLDIISRITAVVLRKQNVSEDDIWKLKDQIKRRKHMALFDEWQGFDVQEERKKGGEMRMIDMVCRKLSKGLIPEEIAELYEEDVFHIRDICEIAKEYAPEYDSEKIYERLAEKVSAVV